MARAHLTQKDLGERSGLGGAIIGRIARGEVDNPAPDQANRLVTHLPITMEDYLEACGYNIAPSSVRRVPAALIEALARVPHIHEGVLLLAQQAASQAPQEGRSEP